jgi:hypothetical protein
MASVFTPFATSEYDSFGAANLGPEFANATIEDCCIAIESLVVDLQTKLYFLASNQVAYETKLLNQKISLALTEGDASLLEDDAANDKKPGFTKQAIEKIKEFFRKVVEYIKNMIAKVGAFFSKILAKLKDMVTTNKRYAAALEKAPDSVEGEYETDFNLDKLVVLKLRTFQGDIEKLIKDSDTDINTEYALTHYYGIDPSELTGDSPDPLTNYMENTFKTSDRKPKKYPFNKSIAKNAIDVLKNADGMINRMHGQIFGKVMDMVSKSTTQNYKKAVDAANKADEAGKKQVAEKKKVMAAAMVIANTASRLTSSFVRYSNDYIVTCRAYAAAYLAAAKKSGSAKKEHGLIDLNSWFNE